MLNVETDDLFTLTPADVGQRLGRSPRTVSRWCSLRWIRAIRLPNGDYRIPPSEVEAAIQYGVPTPSSVGARYAPPRSIDPGSARLFLQFRKQPDDPGRPKDHP